MVGPVVFFVIAGALIHSQGEARSREQGRSLRFCERICLNYPYTAIGRRQQALHLEVKPRSVFLRHVCQCLEKPRRRRSDVKGSERPSNYTAPPAEPQKPTAEETCTAGGEVYDCRPNKETYRFSKEIMDAEVIFTEVNRTWQAHVSWEEVTGDDWEHLRFYRVHWSDKDQDFTHCRSVPKDKLDTVIMSSCGWTFPNKLLLTVIPMPQNRTKTPLKQFDPNTYPPPLELKSPKNAVTLIMSISGGTLVGLLLLFVALWYRRRVKAKYPRCQPRALNSSQDGGLYLVSYYPESDEYIGKVVNLVGRFRSQGYDMVMDRMATTEISSLGPERWTVRELSRARKVLVLCSRTYVELCIDRDEALGPHATQTDKRVLYEVGLLADHYFHTLSASKMVCIQMGGDSIPGKDVPLWMRVTYRWPDDFKNILHRLNDKNEFEAVV